MLDAFPIVVPTLDRRLSGVLRPVAGPRAGVLLLDGTGRQAPLVPRIFDELELYFQAADLVTLRLSLPALSTLPKRVSGVLGGVSLLSSMGAKRVLVVTSAFDPLASWEEARGGTLVEFVEFAEQGRALPEIVRIVRDLTTTIRDVADSTVGVATLLVRSDFSSVAAPSAPAPAHADRRHPREPLAGSLGPSDSSDTPASPPALLLPLPSAGDDVATRRAVAPLLTQLYSWSMALAREPRLTPAATDARAADGAVADATLVAAPAGQPRGATDQQAIHTMTKSLQFRRLYWSVRIKWADDQWSELLRLFTTRAPALAEQARARIAQRAEPGPGASLQAAKRAWPLLDDDARHTWLQVCSAVFKPDNAAG